MAEDQWLSVAHISLTNDFPIQVRVNDLRRVLYREARRHVQWVTGTGCDSPEAFHAFVNGTQGWYFFCNQFSGPWIAYPARDVDPHYKSDGAVFGVHGSAGKYRERWLERLTIYRTVFGQITILAGHYVPWKWNSANRNIASAISVTANAWAGGVDTAGDLFFYAGDQEMNDRYHDTFYGYGLTTTWDQQSGPPGGGVEDAHYPTGQGMGCRDVLASYDTDTRVHQGYSDVVKDARFYLNTRHYVVEGGWWVAPV